MSASQRAEATQRLEDIQRILERVPALASPQGFEIQPHYYGGGRRLGPGDRERRDYVIEYMLMLAFHVPNKKVGGEGCICITVTVNSNSNFGGQGFRDADGREIYVEVGRGEQVPHATQVYGRLSPSDRSIVDVLFTPGGAEPWKPVTRDEFYRATILDYEGKDGATLSETRAALGKSPYQEWMEGADERRRTREETLRMLAMAQSPTELAKTRKVMEDTEREVTERLRATEAEDKARNAAGVSTLAGRSAKLRSELTSMSSDQRRMPALVDNASAEGPDATGWRLVDEDSPTAWRVLMPDYEYWRARRSLVEPRSLVVHIGATGTGLRPPVHHALWQAFKTLEWVAFARILEPAS